MNLTIIASEIASVGHSIAVTLLRNDKIICHCERGGAVSQFYWPSTGERGNLNVCLVESSSAITPWEA
jgi:hypothetical protein